MKYPNYYHLTVKGLFAIALYRADETVETGLVWQV